MSSRQAGGRDGEGVLATPPFYPDKINGQSGVFPKKMREETSSTVFIATGVSPRV